MSEPTPTPKMVDEAINWTGPWLDNRKRWWWQRRISSQAYTYVGVLRRFAMQVTMHEDFMREFLRENDDE